MKSLLIILILSIFCYANNTEYKQVTLYLNNTKLIFTENENLYIQVDKNCVVLQKKELNNETFFSYNGFKNFKKYCNIPFEVEYILKIK